MRRDYEFADRVGTHPVWEAFVQKYPSGFFTALAKAQRDKIAAEAARVEATIKAKAAQEEQTRLASEGAKAAEQAKATEQARVAERARLAAELAKKAEEAKVAEAERAKAAALAKAAEEERAKAAKISEEKAATEAKAAGTKAKEEKLAMLGPAKGTSDQRSTADVPRLLQTELRRVGCYTGTVHDDWNSSAQKSLEAFNKNAGSKLDIKVASIDALDVVKSKTTRVCPLAKLEEPKREGAERAKTESTPSPVTSTQHICNNTGCRPVRQGCHVESRTTLGGTSYHSEICK